MTSSVRYRSFALASALALSTAVLPACGGDDDDAAEDVSTTTAALATSSTAPASGPATSADAPSTSAGAPSTSPAGPPTSAAECVGEPIHFMAIVTTYPTGGGNAAAIEAGITAAEQAADRECALGRPIEVAVCDDHADANENLACGREAAESGALAIIQGVGVADSGVTASELPGVMLAGIGAFDLTAPNAYSSRSGLLLALSGMSAAKALGAENYTIVIPDTPTVQFVAAQLGELASVLDIEFESVLIPADATDYAPFAAQIAATEPDSIGVGVSNPVLMLNALVQEGISPAEMPITIPAAQLTPTVVAEMGANANGVIAVSQEFPLTAEDNPGIAQIRRDLEAAGFDPDDEQLSFQTVAGWGSVHYTVEALSELDPEELASLESQDVVDAMLAASPFSPAEAAPFDFTRNELGETFPAMADLRLFSSSVAILRLEDGVFTPLSDGFIKVTDPPDLSSGE
jgi:branched-chain amino acid transport system substrate-binding protein